MPKPVALITGCSQDGIGDALARQLAIRGYHVFAAVRNLSRAPVFSDEEDINIVTLDGDRLSDGKLDILINNAGCGATGPLIETDMATARQPYEVNVLGVLAVTQAFAPMLIAAQGKVVNISSVGGILAMPWAGLYHSSKAAVTILSETPRLELTPLGVTVITVMLGHIAIDFLVNDSSQGLPESSKYNTVEAQIAKSAEGKTGVKAEKVEDFARRFVGDVLKGSSGQVLRGTMAQTVRTIGYHTPKRVLDGLLLPGSGLDSMTKDAGEDQARE